MSQTIIRKNPKERNRRMFERTCMTMYQSALIFCPLARIKVASKSYGGPAFNSISVRAINNKSHRQQIVASETYCGAAGTYILLQDDVP